MNVHRQSADLRYTICGERIVIDYNRRLHTISDPAKVTCNECKEERNETR